RPTRPPGVTPSARRPEAVPRAARYSSAYVVVRRSMPVSGSSSRSATRVPKSLTFRSSNHQAGWRGWSRVSGTVDGQTACQGRWPCTLSDALRAGTTSKRSARSAQPYERHSVLVERSVDVRSLAPLFGEYIGCLVPPAVEDDRAALI